MVPIKIEKIMITAKSRKLDAWTAIKNDPTVMEQFLIR